VLVAGLCATLGNGHFCSMLLRSLRQRASKRSGLLLATCLDHIHTVRPQEVAALCSSEPDGVASPAHSVAGSLTQVCDCRRSVRISYPAFLASIADSISAAHS
jgi:hypothetical protein